MGHQYDRKEFFIGDGFRESKCDLSANCLTFELTMVHLLSSNILCVTLRVPVIRLLLAFIDQFLVILWMLNAPARYQITKIIK